MQASAAERETAILTTRSGHITGDLKAANKAWGTARYQAAPDEFWDNRPKKASGEYKPNSPDLKHKESGLAVWL